MKKQKARRSVAIVGLGNWGSSLAHGLHAASVPLSEVIVSRQSPRRVISPVKATAVTPVTLENATLDAEIFWLCVPDAVIAPLARKLVRRAKRERIDLRGCLVVHSSGALGLQILDVAAAAGARVASVHPVMSFPTRRPVSLRDVPFGVEADPPTRRVLYSIIRQIGGNPFAIPSGNKALYHAAGMLASPLLVGHLAAAMEAAELAGMDPRAARDLVEPIARATLGNFFERGAQKSFSGPIARGDVDTIRLHLRALEPHPMLAGVYSSLARYVVAAAPPARRRALKRLFRG